MKPILIAICTLFVLTSLPLAAETVDGILIDKMCSGMVGQTPRGKLTPP